MKNKLLEKIVEIWDFLYGLVLVGLIIICVYLIKFEYWIKDLFKKGEGKK